MSSQVKTKLLNPFPGLKSELPLFPGFMSGETGQCQLVTPTMRGKTMQIWSRQGKKQVGMN